MQPLAADNKTTPVENQLPKCPTYVGNKDLLYEIWFKLLSQPDIQSFSVSRKMSFKIQQRSLFSSAHDSFQQQITLFVWGGCFQQDSELTRRSGCLGNQSLNFLVLSEELQRRNRVQQLWGKSWVRKVDFPTSSFLLTGTGSLIGTTEASLLCPQQVRRTVKVVISIQHLSWRHLRTCRNHFSHTCFSSWGRAAG